MQLFRQFVSLVTARESLEFTPQPGERLHEPSLQEKDDKKQQDHTEQEKVEQREGLRRKELLGHPLETPLQPESTHGAVFFVSKDDHPLVTLGVPFSETLPRGEPVRADPGLQRTFP